MARVPVLRQVRQHTSVTSASWAPTALIIVRTATRAVRTSVPSSSRCSRRQSATEIPSAPSFAPSGFCLPSSPLSRYPGPPMGFAERLSTLLADQMQMRFLCLDLPGNQAVLLLWRAKVVIVC